MIGYRLEGYAPTNPGPIETIKLNFKLHTIILLVGPSGAGKTQFCFEQLMMQLKMAQTGNKKINIQYISSDAIRRELLDNPHADKMDKEMTYVSHQAFELLFSRLKCATSYPVNADFVIVDTTGLDSVFRQEVLNIAKDKHYHVSVILFDYKNRKEYNEPIQDGPENMFVSNKHVDKFKKVVLSEIRQKDYESIHRIKSREFEKYEAVITDYEAYDKHVLPFGPEYVIIGDIHGSYDEFMRLLNKHGFIIDENKKVTHPGNKRVVLVGDLIDKGYAIKEVVELAYANIDSFYMVIGNHENYVYKHIKGLLKKDDIAPAETINEFFNSIEIFEQDEELKNKFFAVVEAMKGFFIHRDFVVTHAPCEVKYLAKIDSKSLSKQRNFNYPKSRDFKTKELYEEKKAEAFSFLTKEAHSNQPIHVFGHVMSQGIGRHANKLNIDTGCVAGGALTSVIVNPNGRLFFDSVSSKENEKIQKHELTEFFPRAKSKSVELKDLDSYDRGRVLYSAKDKINFISGTVCPADKNEEANELETLEKAFEYYQGKGVTNVVLQPKYMGSRANVYLFKKPELNYTVTRNGYVIKQIDLTDAYTPLYDIPYIKKRFSEGMDMILLDTELMPWAAIGKNLIEKDFVTVEKAVTSEVEFLQKNNFEKVLLDYYNGPYAESKYNELSHKTSKEEMKNIFGHDNEQNFRNLKQFMRSFVPVEEMQKNIAVFSKQIELYGSEGTVHFKPFSILKEVNEDGKEILFFEESNAKIYSLISSDNYIVVDLNSQEDIQKAKDFYRDITENQEMEGVMVKPNIVYNPGVAPCLKVRNPRYLTIIYGPDYTFEVKFKKLISRKSIKNKLKTSISEFELGKKMLEIPYAEINEKNQQYINAIAQMIIEEKNEQTLDPRL